MLGERGSKGFFFLGIPGSWRKEKEKVSQEKEEHETEKQNRDEPREKTLQASIVPFLCQSVWNVKQLQIERLLGNGFGLHH